MAPRKKPVNKHANLRTAPGTAVVAAPVVRSSGPRNRALRDEDQPAIDPAVAEREAFELQVRSDAKSGLAYGTIAKKHGLSLAAFMTIIQPDLVQYQDIATGTLIEPEFDDEWEGDAETDEDEDEVDDKDKNV